MINFDFRFPLFDSIMVGSLSPFLPENSNSAYLNEENYGIGLDSIQDEGQVGFTFYKPANFKCRFYYHKIVQETFLYCNELIHYLKKEKDADARAYLRLTLLDKHLKTCLLRLGELLHTNNLHSTHFLHPTHDTNPEIISNSYVFHLLKACLAKAYLEAQLALLDVIHTPFTEASLYTAMVGELPPVNCFLKPIPIDTLQQRSRMAKDQDLAPPAEKLTGQFETSKPEITQATATVDTKLYTVKDLVAMKIGSDRTIRRLLEKKELIGIKQKNGWRIEDVELQRYWIKLKTQKH